MANISFYQQLGFISFMLADVPQIVERFSSVQFSSDLVQNPDDYIHTLLECF